MAVNPYSVQQPFNMTYPNSMAHAATYPGTTEISSSLTNPVEARNTYPIMNRSPTIKAETHSPVQPSQIFPEPSYIEDYRSASAGETETGITFSTDVDTLMKAIQAKSRPTQSPEQATKVHYLERKIQESEYLLAVQAEAATLESPRSNKSRKRYQCGLPDCNKSFYQKTHLDIHTRAHTGVKPFVSFRDVRLRRNILTRFQLCKEPSCGQRFSQLGNLKVGGFCTPGDRLS